MSQRNHSVKQQQAKKTPAKKSVRTYAAPQLVVLGSTRDLVQGGNSGRYYDFRRGYYPGS